MNANKKINHTVIIYDGFCVLCNKLTNILMRIDRKKRLKFSALDSDYSISLEKDNEDFPSSIDSIVLYKKGKFYIKMDAVIEISKTLGGIYYIAYLLKAIPGKWRNDLYDYIARNRYRWFGKHDSCQMPDQDYKDRVL